jgi:hypothetical protein
MGMDELAGPFDIIQEELIATREESGSTVITLPEAHEYGWAPAIPTRIRVLEDGRIILEPYDMTDVDPDATAHTDGGDPDA